MSAEVDRRDLEVAEPLDVAVTKPDIHRNGQRIGVVRSCRSAGAGRGHQLTQGADVVPMLVGSGDSDQLRHFGSIRFAVLQEYLNGWKVIGGVDQQLHACGLRGQQIHVVVHLADGDAPYGDVTR
ncbi:hypothetical protein StoSoilB13_23950 [Arthrobacter sp. StoSoilB13]|nr:hypothetical protein StoSoilB13_23950 [Arthrobacter sp. StoSoilB13]